MNDSCINPAFLSSSAHLENVEQLIKNIEQQTLNGDNFDDISSNNDNNRQEITTKSFTSISSNTLPIHNHHHHSKNITLLDGSNITVHNNDEDHSVDSLLIQRDLLFNNDELKQQISPINDQNLLNEQDAGYTWDDQYDTRANYRLTFSTDKSQHVDSKIPKPRRYKNRSISEKISPTFSDDDISSNLTNNMNDWSMRSSTNTFEQLINQSAQIHSQSNPPPPPPPAPSSCQQQQQQTPTNHSSGSSTTSSSTSWRQMKESHRTTTATETKETRPPSPLCLYKIFQQKSNTTTTSSPSRNIFPLKRYQKDTNTPNHINEINTDKSKSSHLSTDQAIQTSILLDSPSNTRYRTTSVTAPKSESFNYLTIPTRNSFVASHKSLPDLSFISQYSKELPRSRTASPTTTSPVNINRTTPSPILIQHPPKQDADRPRTLKSIKRYKNSKHSTEPLGVFYSPQLRKTFAAIPITLGSNTPSPIETNLKLSSSNLKSCLKYGSRANSCDIQDMVQNHKSTPEHASNNDLIFSAFKNRSSDIERFKHLDTVWTTKICSNKLSAYVLPDSSRGHHSEHDLLSLIEQENSTKKSVSFSENISKQLLSPCNPTIAFNDNPPLALYDNNERLTKRTTIRYRDMRRCQTDIIVVDPVLHLHSFTDSPPNEFCLQRDEDDNDDDSEDILMEKSHINIIPNLDEPVPIIEITPSSPLNQTEFVAIEKENKPSIAMSASTLDRANGLANSHDFQTPVEEESLHRLLNSPDCLDEAAITLNFLTRRLFCDIFEEPLFKDLIKEKIELKLKEIAVSVLEDLHVETIDMGNTFPVILKVEPMQWNTKGIWFNLFLFYKGNFNFTIKTRIVLQKLLNYNPIADQPMYYQHQSGQIVHKDEERQETEELIQRQKLLAKEPEIPENAAARKLGILLTKVAANKHFQRFAALKPVAGVIEKLSNAEVGANIELMSFSGMMTINIPPPPSDRIWIGFSEMPDLNLKVTPVFGESKYSYTLIHDFLEARIRDEIKVRFI
ncbi:unnamed protein product [Adineta steineri]|uniref:SMP-LTD domain-containing protein n=1 Tax=Adineta steineri TaxID=433720 RepID=A0A814WHW5_9BILA|nr:unnamed protein product [Adineta steineri]